MKGLFGGACVGLLLPLLPVLGRNCLLGWTGMADGDSGMVSKIDLEMNAVSTVALLACVGLPVFVQCGRDCVDESGEGMNVSII